ncbi:MAG: hypothetical protein ACTSWW_01290 [Promethearchaeota archaeon]
MKNTAMFDFPEEFEYDENYFWGFVAGELCVDVKMLTSDRFQLQYILNLSDQEIKEKYRAASLEYIADRVHWLKEREEEQNNLKKVHK